MSSQAFSVNAFRERYWPTTPNIVGFCMLRPFAHPVACCSLLLGVVVQSLKPVKLNGRSISQHCWPRPGDSKTRSDLVTRNVQAARNHEVRD